MPLDPLPVKTRAAPQTCALRSSLHPPEATRRRQDQGRRAPAGDHANLEKEAAGGPCRLLLTSRGRDRPVSVCQGFRSRRNRNAYKEGAVPEPAPRICGAARTGKTPVLAGAAPAPMSVPAQWTLTPGLLGDSGPWPGRFSLSLWCLSCPLTPKFAGGKLAAPRPAVSKGNSPGWSLKARRSTYPPSPPRPPYSLDCSIVGLPQGDRGSMVSEAGACSAGDCGCGKPLRPTDSPRRPRKPAWLTRVLVLRAGIPRPAAGRWEANRPGS